MQVSVAVPLPRLQQVADPPAPARGRAFGIATPARSSAGRCGRTAWAAAARSCWCSCVLLVGWISVPTLSTTASRPASNSGMSGASSGAQRILAAAGQRDRIGIEDGLGERGAAVGDASPRRPCVEIVARLVVGDDGVGIIVAAEQEDADQRLVVAGGRGRGLADRGEVHRRRARRRRPGERRRRASGRRGGTGPCSSRFSSFLHQIFGRGQGRAGPRCRRGSAALASRRWRWRRPRRGCWSWSRRPAGRRRARCRPRRPAPGCCRRSRPCRHNRRGNRRRPRRDQHRHIVDVGDHRRLVGDLEFGRDQAGGGDGGVGRRVAGAEEVEHAAGCGPGSGRAGWRSRGVADRPRRRTANWR